MAAIKMFLFLSAMVFFLGACQEQKAVYSEQISAASIADSDLPPATKAEELSKASEKLFDAGGYGEALETANLALTFDRRNLRASFLKALLDVIILQKGLFERVYHMASQQPRLLAEYKKKIHEFPELTSPKLYNYMKLKGQPEILNETQLQAHADLTYEALDRLRLFLKSRQNETLTLNGSTLFLKNLPDRYAQACEIKASAKFVYELICPSLASRFKVTLNRADFAKIHSEVAYYQTYLAVVNSYDLAGGTSIYARQIGKKKISAQQVSEELLQNPDFGKLRTQSRMQDIKSIGLDLLPAMNYAIANQAELCPHGYPQPKSRLGKYMNEGFCIGSDVQDLMTQANAILKSSQNVYVLKNRNQAYPLKQTLLTFIEKPIPDLHMISPLKFNQCNNLVSAGDPTVGGLLPYGDLSQALRFMNPPCDRQ